MSCLVKCCARAGDAKPFKTVTEKSRVMWIIRTDHHHHLLFQVSIPHLTLINRSDKTYTKHLSSEVSLCISCSNTIYLFFATVCLSEYSCFIRQVNILQEILQYILCTERNRSNKNFSFSS